MDLRFGTMTDPVVVDNDWGIDPNENVCENVDVPFVECDSPMCPLNDEQWTEFQNQIPPISYEIPIIEHAEYYLNALNVMYTIGGH